MKIRAEVSLRAACLAALLFCRLGAAAQTWEDFNQQGLELFQQKKVQEAIVSFEQAKVLVADMASPTNPNYAVVCNNLGAMYLMANQLDKAEENLLIAESIRAKLLSDEDVSLAYVRNSLAMLYDAQNKSTEALKYRIGMQRAYQKNFGKNSKECLILYDKIAQHLKTLGRRQEEISYLMDCKPIIELLYGTESYEFATVCIKIGDWAFHSANYPLAAEQISLGIRLIQKTKGPNSIEYANACTDIASTWMKMNNFQAAESLFVEARTLKRKLLGEHHAEYAMSCNNLGYLYMYQDQFEKAESLYREARAIVSQGNNPRFEAIFAINLGLLYKQQGLYAEALSLNRQAEEALNRLSAEEAQPYFIMLYDNWANLYLAQSLYAQALLYAEKAHQLLADKRETRGEDYLKNLQIRAILLAQQQKYEEALALVQEAKQVLVAQKGKNSLEYGILCDNEAGLWVHLKKTNKAALLFQEAESIIEKAVGIWHKDYGIVCANSASFYFHQHKPALAYQQYRKLIQNLQNQIKVKLPVLSETERKSFLKSIQYTWEEFQFFAFQHIEKYPEIAGDLLNLQLTIKGILFYSTLEVQQKIGQSNDSLLIQKYQTWKAQCATLAQYLQMSLEEKASQQITPAVEAELLANTNALEKELSLASKDFKLNFAQESVQWQDLQALLTANEALVDIVRIEYTVPNTTQNVVVYAALLLTAIQSLPQIISINTEGTLDTRYYTYYLNKINNQGTDDYSYVQFWSKIQAQLPASISKVYLCADGVYHLINLGTLVNPQNGEFIGDRLKINLLANAKDLQTAKSGKQLVLTNELLLLGSPSYQVIFSEKPTADSIAFISRSFLPIELTNGSILIASLPGTLQEVQNIEAIARLLGLNCKALTGDDANEMALSRIQNPSILHIATHGFFLANLPPVNKNEQIRNQVIKLVQNPLLRSGLLLAGVEQALRGIPLPANNDGILTAQEALQLNLAQTELVVLSACETGLGKLFNGEGVYGLQRAFLQAGADAVLMSLWKVSDEATTLLMTSFYEHLLLHRLPKSEALFQAQQTVRKKFKEPYYWGAFVLIGH